MLILCVSIPPPGDVTLGSTAGATALYVYGATTFESSSAPITANAALVANAGLTVSGTSVLGQTSSDLLTVNAAANFTAGQTVLFGNSSTAASSAVLQFQRRAAAAAVTNGTVLGEVQFTGWDSAANGLGAQIRSVFTVSLFSSSSASCFFHLSPVRFPCPVSWRQKQSVQHSFVLMQDSNTAESGIAACCCGTSSESLCMTEIWRPVMALIFASTKKTYLHAQQCLA